MIAQFFIIIVFSKDPAGRYIVLYTFIARDENDVSVERGEFVTVLNREDPDWYWIVRSDGQEGFVPSGFVYPADVIQGRNLRLILESWERLGVVKPRKSTHSSYDEEEDHLLLNSMAITQKLTGP